MSRRRVVVTGLGMVSPLGNSVKIAWPKLIKGESGVKKIITSNSVKIAATVNFDPSLYFTKSETKRLSKFMQYALVAAEEAISDSNWINLNESQKMATGVCIGSGIGSIQDVIDSIGTLNEKGERKINPYFVPRLLTNLAAGHVSMKHGFRGPNHCASTACTTGAHSIGDAARFIEYGDADVMVAGGSEASIHPLAIAGFSSLRALSTKYNDYPEKASRPFDKDRDGFVMGEGAGVVVLEEYEHAKKRGAKIYCELAGYGLSGDAYHITSPPLDGNGAIRAMKRAIELGRVTADEVDYVNAHATSTPVGDKIEMNSIKAVCGDQIAVSSTKGSIGHLLGASGAVEAIFTVLAVHTDIIPPNLNLDNPDCEDSSIRLITLRNSDNSNVSRRCGDGKGVTVALTNSFGFGGTNASLLFKKI